MRLAKRILKGALARAGYVVLKKSYYDGLSGVAPGISSGTTSAERSDMEARKNRARELGYGDDFVRFLDRACPASSLSLELAHAVFSAACELRRTGIAGDVVECRNGLCDVLAVVGASLNFIGDTQRRLILLDVSGDPTLRPDADMALWGVDQGLIGKRSVKPRNANQSDPRLIPAPLREIFYPEDRISVMRGMAGMLKTADVPRLIAFLALSADSYLENRAAIADLLSRLAVGGTLVVHRRVMALTTSDPVAELVRARQLPIALRDIGGGYSIGVLGGRPEDGR